MYTANIVLAVENIGKGHYLTEVKSYKEWPKHFATSSLKSLDLDKISEPSTRYLRFNSKFPKKAKKHLVR